MDRLVSLYKQCFGVGPDCIVPIAGEGSNRRYYRLDGVQRCIGTIGTQKRENEAFIYLSDFFSTRGLPVPEVYAVSDDRMAYLQQYVGERSLYDEIVARGSDDPFVKKLLVDVMVALPRFQYSASDDFDSNRCYPLPEMDVRAIKWDLNYFKYCFLKPVGLEFDELALETDFDRLADDLSKNPDSTLIMRDFQSRNIMLDDEGNPFVIDFQGTRLGDGLYDIASFVWQARADYSDETKKLLVDTYRAALPEAFRIDDDEFNRRLDMMILFRTIQVLGAYGFRGYIERKSKFLVSIPQAIVNLKQIIYRVPRDRYPYLISLLEEMVQLTSLQKYQDGEGLTVTVMSFSYKKGLPTDGSGNGGGFVFDCRGLHNPGRYDRYKLLTGRDKPVIDFLEDRGEIGDFLSDCYKLVDRTVDSYLRRGFSSLMVCFGCTGGRHRSVYSAEHMASHLNEKFGIRVRLIHREQNINELFEAK